MRCVSLFSGCGGLDLGILEALDSMSELAHARPVRLRDPHHLGDDLQWQLARDVVHEVAAPLREGPFESLRKGVARESLELLDRTRRSTAHGQV